MEKLFEAEDIKRLYSAFIALCDYVEKDPGCGKCPLWKTMCGNKDKSEACLFGDALARIRQTAEIPNP